MLHCHINAYNQKITLNICCNMSIFMSLPFCGEIKVFNKLNNVSEIVKFNPKTGERGYADMWSRKSRFVTWPDECFGETTRILIALEITFSTDCGRKFAWWTAHAPTKISGDAWDGSVASVELCRPGNEWRRYVSASASFSIPGCCARAPANDDVN